MTLAALQSRLRDLVAARPLLAGRPVLIEDKGNLVSDLESALAESALAVVIAPSSGQTKPVGARGRSVWEDLFDVVVHRGPLAEETAPSTVTLIDDLRTALNGAPLDATIEAHGLFACSRHELRENGDGTYARVLTVTVNNSVS